MYSKLVLWFVNRTTCKSDEKCQILNGVVACVNIDPCKSIACRIQETCKIQKGIPVCVPNYTSYCSAQGDPHYRTFDGYKFDFQGTCTYVLSKSDGDDKGLVPFMVTEKNENRGSQSVSFVRTVNIYVYGYKITIIKKEFGKIRVNDVLVCLPVSLPNGKISVAISGLNAVLKTDFGLTLSYNYDSCVVIQLISSYFNLTRGLCGNFNQNNGDEKMTIDNNLVPSIIDWAKSWKVPDLDPFCFDFCPKNCPSCSEDERSLYGGDKQCGLIRKTDGPFRECFGKNDTDTSYMNCLYDVCIYKGAKKFLCESLKDYADICRRQGVTIYDWRTPSGCVLPCPENSHYEFCGTACPATCVNPAAPSGCTDNCVESCLCNDNYVLSVDKCVPLSKCGSQFNGSYVPPDEPFWADDDCHFLCQNDPVLAMVTCIESSCKPNEQCVLVNGVRTCQPASYAQCSATGDPHFTTFDGKKYDFMGTCIYLLVGVTNGSSLPVFTIKLQNNIRGNPAASHAKVVTLVIYGLVLTLSRDYPLQILINGVATSLPFIYQTNKVNAYNGAGTGCIKTDIGVTVTFDWNENVYVTVPVTYFKNLTGLCGNYNSNSNDDFTMKDGMLTSDPTQFGNSWKVGDVPGCSSQCTGNCPTCTDAQQQAYIGDNYCGLIKNRTGPFANCISVIDPTPFFRDCTFDTCLYRGLPSSYCGAISRYVAACQAAGITIQTWRTDNFCALSCPVNSHYELCGNACPVTCQGLSSPAGCQSRCKEGCYCDNSFVLSGGKCTLVGECGCFYEGVYYQKGEVFYLNDQCTQKCRCGEDGIVQCLEDSCGPTEDCKVVNGVRGCFSKSSSTCVALGDPPYFSVDGLCYYFQGVCAFVLATAISNDAKLVSFEVTMVLDDCQSLTAYITKTVLVTMYSYQVAIETDPKLKVKVNGEVVKLPISLSNGKIIIYQEGNTIVIQTDFGLRVVYDAAGQVIIQIPDAYLGKTIGLCGNFVGDPTDDLQFPNAPVDKKVKFLGKSFKVNVTGGNRGQCILQQGPCPSVTTDRKNTYTTTSSCGMITDSNGPFKACQAIVNPQPYFSSCIYDAVLSSGNVISLCMSLQAYATVCQRAGVSISNWRTQNFCPLTCPVNSHYELCTRTCDNSCYELSSEIRCSDTCVEGCASDPGFLYDGETCVSAEKCGCVFDGRYLSDGSSFVNFDCTQKCTCQSGVVTCQPMACKSTERCQVRYGVRNCYSIQADCLITSATFSTFDGASGGPVPLGAFVVISICNYCRSWFRVVADVQTCAPNAQAVTRIHVFSLNSYITISKDKDAWLNGVPVPLPFNMLNVASVSSTDTSISIQIGQYVTVVLSSNGELKVTVRDGISDNLCGACGKFNGVMADDLQTPNGTTVSGIQQLIASWTAKDITSCGPIYT
ncbi:IgGFc-binding protein-like [Hyperolius riggenbachi]|uniref:IgGFc-binding protein-like n=1 Tax=Hyperolius riggenbachi TaxID=752182 RepID=UPI0035A36F87